MLSEAWGRSHFWLTFLGFNLTFMIQHVLGLLGMPRRVFTYPDLPDWGRFNMISTAGAYLLGFSVLVFLWNVFASLRAGRSAGDNPWNAWTLEWATPSPPPEHNFDLVPPVRGRRPLWDLAHPDRPDPVPARLYGLRSEEHTSELQSRLHLVCRLLLEKKKNRDWGCLNMHHSTSTAHVNT